MRHRAEQVEGKSLDTRQYAQFTALQRQVANTLVQGFRADRGPAQARYDTYGEHLATLQRHEISAPVSRVVLGLVPPGERLALQRAVDTAVQRYEAEAALSATAAHRQTLQRQLAELDAEATQPVLQRIQARRGGGNPLPEAIQRHLEQGLNHDLSRVRIHDDAEADRLAKGVNALAFTTGSDIFFQSGRFNPNSQSGLELLAHEVTHTVQQSQGRVGPGVDPDAGLEAEARTMGAKLAATPMPQKARPVQRQVASPAPATAVQRWGLGDLKKLAGSARDKLKSAVGTVQKAAQQRIQKTVARVQKAAAPAIKAAREAASQTLKQAQALRARVRTQIQAAGKTAREYGRKTLQTVKDKGQQAVQSARDKAAQLRVQAHQLAVRAASTVVQVQTKLKDKARIISGTLRQAASIAALNLRDKATAARTKLKTAATGLLNNVKTRAQNAWTQAKAAGQQVRQRLTAAAASAKTKIAALAKTAATKAQSLKRRIGAKATRALRTAKGGLGKFLKNRPATALLLGTGAAFTAFQAIKKGGVKGLVNAVKGNASEAWKWATSTEGKATLARLAVTVGVTVGAAALTGLTGGLAAPLLIMAAGSAGGGALGRLAQNAVLRTDDKYKDKVGLMQGVLDPKAMAFDAALGVVMGPGAALAGGLVKGAAGNLGRYALRPMGKGLVQGARRVIGGRLGSQTASRAALGTQQSVGRQAMMNRVQLLWKDMKQYNSKLAKETWDEMKQSLYGSAGVAGKAAKDTKLLLGGRKALKAKQFDIARDRVSVMDHREVLTLASKLKLPSHFSQSRLRELVAQGLVKTNHQLVARPIAQQALKAARGRFGADLKRAAFGAPKRRGETMARRLLRGAGNLLTFGPRATYRTMLEKDAGWSKAIREGVGTGHMIGSMSNEAVKGAVLAAKTEMVKPDGQQEPINGLKLARDSFLNALGFNPDYLSEKAIGAAATDAAKSANSSVGAAGMNDPLQLEDAPKVAGP
ncbi:eCIS core domain-containing protein [Deinococcus multiflagellatus]|uniref:DUF4157 domain-containing protein n=2 Tax=Deinococcus multiflagellatus TaxID=1656887 RepID=A0ABW1ZKK3_9DEIO